MITDTYRMAGYYILKNHTVFNIFYCCSYCRTPVNQSGYTKQNEEESGGGRAGEMFQIRSYGSYTDRCRHHGGVYYVCLYYSVLLSDC